MITISSVIDMVDTPGTLRWYAFASSRRRTFLWMSDVKDTEDEAVEQVIRYLRFMFGPHVPYNVWYSSRGSNGRTETTRRLPGESIRDAAERTLHTPCRYETTTEIPPGATGPVQRRFW